MVDVEDLCFSVEASGDESADLLQSSARPLLRDLRS